MSNLIKMLTTTKMSERVIGIPSRILPSDYQTDEILSDPQDDAGAQINGRYICIIVSLSVTLVILIVLLSVFVGLYTITQL